MRIIEECEQEFLLESQVEALQLRLGRELPDFSWNGRHNRAVSDMAGRSIH